MKSMESKKKELVRTRLLLRSASICARHARGQMMVVFALAAVTLVGVMALGADVGVLYYNWGELQKAADAAALAGAAQLNGQVDSSGTIAANAKAYAASYACLNGLSDANQTADVGLSDSKYASQRTLMTSMCTPNASNTTDSIKSITVDSNNSYVQIALSRQVPYSFARALGLTSGVVAVVAKAAPPAGICSVNAGPGNPISCGGSDCTTSGGATATASDCPPPSTPGGATGTPFPGGCGTSTGAYNVLPIALDYSTLTKWSQGTAYALNRMDTNGANGPWVAAPGNWGFVDLCGSTGGSALRSSIANGYYGELTIGNTLTTQPGVSNGNVSKGLNGLLDRAPSNSTTPTTSNFNNPPDPRAVVIPLVDFTGANGKSNLPIKGFMAFYINSVDTGSTNSNGVNGVINGTFIGMADPNSTTSINAPKAGAMGDIVLIR
jgi:Flp pilus assembly protein TadG